MKSFLDTNYNLHTEMEVLFGQLFLEFGNNFVLYLLRCSITIKEKSQKNKYDSQESAT